MASALSAMGVFTWVPLVNLGKPNPINVRAEYTLSDGSKIGPDEYKKRFPAPATPFAPYFVDPYTRCKPVPRYVGKDQFEGDVDD
ncbi:MAG: hypothetical protein ACYTFW_03710 [Planctomycetota bacterium]